MMEAPGSAGMLTFWPWEVLTNRYVLVRICGFFGLLGGWAARAARANGC
jgi:hypothetical protein